MTELEATALLLVLGSRGLCVRAEVDGEGSVHHVEQPRLSRTSPRLGTGMIAAAALGVAACSPAGAPPSQVPSVPAPPPATVFVDDPDPAPVRPVSPIAADDAANEPADGDKDNDGIPDAVDACPREPGSPSAEPGKNGCPTYIALGGATVRILEGIQFRRGGRALDTRGEALVKEIAKLLKDNPGLKIAVEGHASADEASAAKLSKARAEAVVSALRKLDVDPSRLVVESYGAERPIPDDGTKGGPERNRRVDFKVIEECPPPSGVTPSSSPVP
jgi:outer membrane protein OmpA-like peptidoglycan-associated protein